MGNLIRNAACPQCSKTGRGKSLSIYSDGQYCNECGYSSNTTTNVKRMSIEPKQENMISVGEYRDIPSRGITAEAAEKYNYSASEHKGRICRVASFKSGGAIVAQKLKFKPPEGKDKSDYVWLGNKNLAPALFGMDLFEPNAKLSITITEGEDDCVCLASLQGCRWPVVSLPDGAGPQALNAIAKAKEYLMGFRKVVLMFDGDETGRQTAEKCAELLGPKAYVAQMLEGEDVCSIYQKMGAKAGQFLDDLAIKAISYRPKDIVRISDYTDEELYKVDEIGTPLPFPKLNELLRGLKQARLYTLCAGSGLGKSTVVKEIAYNLIFKQNKKIGIIFLEQGDREAMKDFIALDNNIECEDFCDNPDKISKEKRDESRAKIDENAVFYKHFGSLDTDKLISRIEMMMTAYECEYVFLDHISMAVSGQTSSEGERKDIDVLMTKLRTLIQKTGKSVIAVSHLKRTQGRCYNEGGTVSLQDLRGSASLEQISDFVIALERDQFSEINSDLVKLKVLKSRRGGHIGYADELIYNHKTGRLELV